MKLIYKNVYTAQHLAFMSFVMKDILCRNKRLENFIRWEQDGYIYYKILTTGKFGRYNYFAERGLPTLLTILKLKKTTEHNETVIECFIEYMNNTIDCQIFAGERYKPHE